MAAFGAHHEWGKLREVVIGIAPAEDVVVFHEESQRWLTAAGLSQNSSSPRSNCALSITRPQTAMRRKRPMTW